MGQSRTQRLFIVLVAYCLLLTQFSVAASPDKKIQTVVNLLDYIARDYAGAVENKKVVNATEYAEMTDFGTSVYSLSREIAFKQTNDKKPILDQIRQLQQLIAAKADLSAVDSLAKKVRSELITATGFNVLPVQYPNLVAGKSLFKTYCVACHGERGDGNGPAAKGLSPAPTNFLDTGSMRAVSPLAAFNTLSIGLQGTAMRSFSEELNEKQLWDLAFYVKALPASQAGMDSIQAQQILTMMDKSVPLETIAASSDDDLLRLLSGTPAQRQEKLAALRMQVPPSGPNTYIERTKNSLRDALAAYEQGNTTEARQLTLTAYLEGIEPIEAQLKATNPKLTASIEEQMLLIRKLIESGASPQQVRQQIAKASILADEARSVLGEQKFSFWFSFLLTVSILLREGIEAFLIVALLLAIVRKTNSVKAQVWIHGGWITAIAAGFAGWLVSGWILAISGANREIMEGFVSLLAVIILVYVGLWLHSHANGQKWKEFVEIRLSKLVNSESLFGLSFFVFMVVFREAFECILFLQAIKLQTLTSAENAIGWATVASFFIIAGLVAFVLKFSKRLPIPQLFSFFAWIIAFLAVLLIGKGVHSLQEAGFVSVSAVPLAIRVDLLGLYPTLQTIGSQLLLALLFMAVPSWKKKAPQKQRIPEKQAAD
ncbi:cytochrome [Ostertagia ostertagi]